MKGDQANTLTSACCAGSAPNLLLLDEQTLRDLEVFESSVEGTTLFDLCNHTRSRSGGRALKERMKRPFSDPARIHSVQTSLAFIRTHRSLFDTLPSYVTTNIVDRYLKDTLPGVMSGNPVDFGIGVLGLLCTDIRRYDTITQGVGVASELVLSSRQISHEEALLILLDCELADILAEMRELLASKGLSAITADMRWSLSAWKILRADQVFRLHEKEAITRLLQLTHELDALISMADATYSNGFVMPRIEEGPLSVRAEGVVHPLVQDAVPNPACLDQTRRLLFLTGPNMAGKTTYLRAVAVCLYFAHLGMGVPARSFCFVPAQQLFSSISLVDNLHAGVSFFRAEGLRVKAIAQALAEGARVIALMDEPFKGTNVKDAFDASLAIVERFAAKAGSLFMFSSHLIELCDKLASIDQVDCRYFEAREDAGRLRFEYVLHSGVSSQRLGMRVLREEGIFELLDGGAAPCIRTC